MVKEYIKKNDFAEKQYVRGLNLVYDIIFNKRKNVILDCVMKSHQNQMGFLQCPRCNPNDFNNY